MKEFIYGSDEQYEMLKDSLNDHLCHVYSDCIYPKCCRPPKGRIGFEKEGDTYALFIDQGVRITSHRKNTPSLFLEWLSAGTIRFLDYTDLKEFLRSLKCLY